MNLLIKKLSFSLLTIFVLFSCTTEQSLEITSPDPALVLQEPGINSVYLNFSLPENNAFTISWNDDLTGSSSYIVEMSLNAEFTSPVTLGTVNTNSFSINVEDLNTAIRNAGATTFKDIALYLRVIAGSINSNSILFLVTTYPIQNPFITSPDNTFEIVLSDITENETALTVEWEDPFTPEDNSTSVSYYVEAAASGTDFTTVREMGNTQELTFSLTHAELNDIAAGLDIDPDTAGGIDVRVRSVIEMAVGNLQRLSEPITITVTPYETALPPTLWGVGAGLEDAGWNWDSPIEFQLNGTSYSSNVNLTPDNGGNFRFFLQQDWNPDSYNYLWFEDRGYTIDENLVNANDGDSNFQFVGTAGFYNLKIDTANKTITLGPAVVGPNCDYDQLWLVGAGVPDTGWGWDTPVALPCRGNGVYSGQVTFSNDAFRLFAQQDWGPTSFNYPYYESNGYNIDVNFENANDGDSNFRFIGTPGAYFLTVDDINKTITLSPGCNYDQLWLVGAGITDAGWGWDTPVELPCNGNGVYSTQVALGNDAFRFFAQQDWGPTSFNYPYYESNGYSIDANFENANDGDSNFRFIGTPGTYTLKLDDINKTITLSLGQQSPNCDYDQLWLVGAGITDAGWNWDSPVEFPCTGDGVYTTQVALSNDAFRFFAQQDWGPTSFNYPYYESNGYTIDANFENANDGDSNFRFTGTPGTYTLTLDDINKTISLQ